MTRQAERDGVTDKHAQRRYLVLRAALADRAMSLDQKTGLTSAREVDAGLAALGLLQWDREHSTGRGPVAAADPRWDTDPRLYVHQEHALLVLDDEEPPCV